MMILFSLARRAVWPWPQSQLNDWGLHMRLYLNNAVFSRALVLANNGLYTGTIVVIGQ